MDLKDLELKLKDIDLKDLESKVKNVLDQIPYDICKLKPEDLSESQINLLQESIIRSVNLLKTLCDTSDVFNEVIQEYTDILNKTLNEQGKPSISVTT